MRMTFSGAVQERRNQLLDMDSNLFLIYLLIILQFLFITLFSLYFHFIFKLRFYLVALLYLTSKVGELCVEK